VTGDALTDPYDRFTDEDGRSTDYPHLEPEPERWALVLQHDRFHDSLVQFDDLMRDYDHPVELHVGEEAFRDLNHHGERLPTRLNFYIAEDRSTFLDAVNHPLFREVGTDTFVVPAEATIGLAFGEDAYRDVIDVPDPFGYLDVGVPTYLAHTQHNLAEALGNLADEMDLPRR
jgi:hypothetical protein